MQTTHITTTPFTNEEWIILLEVAKISLGDADAFEYACDQMSLSDDVMADLREKLNAFMSSDAPPEGPFVVCEVICQKPSVSIHSTESAALEHAVQCAMENMHNPDLDEAGERTCFRETLGQYEHICDGDYEVYILTPTN